MNHASCACTRHDQCSLTHFVYTRLPPHNPQLALAREKEQDEALMQQTLATLARQEEERKEKVRPVTASQECSPQLLQLLGNYALH